MIETELHQAYSKLSEEEDGKTVAEAQKETLI